MNVKKGCRLPRICQSEVQSRLTFTLLSFQSSLTFTLLSFQSSLCSFAQYGGGGGQSVPCSARPLSVARGVGGCTLLRGWQWQSWHQRKLAKQTRHFSQYLVKDKENYIFYFTPNVLQNNSIMESECRMIKVMS